MYYWVLHHPQVVKQPTANYHLKVSVDDQTEKVIPKLLLQVSVREINNRMVTTPAEGGIKEARYKENNVIIPPQLKKIVC